ncbi:MAG: protein kinase [Ktedonobacteraceae bacterium]|nr:protein kinase [Ktedonobacteraceae bacterium]
MPLPIGTMLDGKFKIVQILGEGGMGTVYKVEQVGNPPYYYAVKELSINPSMSEEDRKAAIDRFNKEIALLRGLKHPHIASLTLPFQERGNSYFVMEFVPGRSLEKILEESNGPLPEDKVIKWSMQVCEALSYIHAQNPPIILRDLKPGNIMVTPSDNVQLIDFGIARRFDPNKRTNTENLGTISYASPEHLGSITTPGQQRTAQNPGRLVQTDARSDVYSLGATIYHLLTNYEPDPIQTPTTGSILAKNPRLRTIQVGNQRVCPIERVIIKAMQQDPGQRFQSAEALRVALQQCLPNATPVAQTVQIPAMTPNATVIVPLPASSGLVCPRCGFQNRAGAKFCKRDGQPLLQGAIVAPPQARTQVSAAQSRIQARPVQQPIRARPAQPIKAQPIASSAVTPPTYDPAAAYRLGLQYLNNKNYTEAVKQFTLALRAGGASYDVHCNLGRTYRQFAQSVRYTDKKLFSENLKLAAEQLEQAIRLNPDAFDAYFQLGLCYRDLALYQQASATFKKAQGLNPQDTGIYYQLGMLAMEQGYNRDAETYFLDGLKINPNHALMLIAIGQLYIKMNQASNAINTLRQAMQLDAEGPEVWYELGRAHMLAREWKMALSALEEAHKRDQQNAAIYCAMATCYLKINKKREARQMVKETLQRDPNNAEAIRLQKQL